MRNFNKFMLATSLTAAAAVTCLTGCQTWQSRSSERTAGRMVDDRQITSNVRSELRHEPVYKFTDVDVKTFDGVVQLSGFVNTDEQKRRAEELAQQVPGVAQVQNAISLKPNNGNYAPTGRMQNNYNRNQNYNNNYNRENQSSSTTTTPSRTTTTTTTANPNQQ